RGGASVCRVGKGAGGSLAAGSRALLHPPTPDQAATQDGAGSGRGVYQQSSASQAKRGVHGGFGVSAGPVRKSFSDVHCRREPERCGEIPERLGTVRALAV